MIKKQLVTILAGFILIAGICWLWFSHNSLITAPPVTFKIIDGRRIDMHHLQGNPVLVTFWASTCHTCIKEMPHIISLYNDLAGKGLEIIGVAMSYDPPNRVLEITEGKKIPYPIALDIDGEIAFAFGDVSLTPTSFLIAPDGTIVNSTTGSMDINELRGKIIKLISKNQIKPT